MQIINKIKNKFKNMDKKAALERLNALDEETKKLKKIIEAPEEITNRIKTFKDACNYLNIKTHKDAYRLLHMKRSYMSEVAIEECEDTYLRLCILTLALNEGTEVDLTKNTGYFPWFNHKNKVSSSFYSSASHAWSDFCVPVSSRLALCTSKLALYSGSQFEQEHYNYNYN